MKKLLMGSVALTLFSISTLIFQMSCKKEANAQTTTNGLTQLNLVLFGKQSLSNGTFLNAEYWLMNTDGTNQRKISLSVPGATNYSVNCLTPNGKKIIFTASFPTSNPSDFINKIYSCDIDGTNNNLLVTGNYTDNRNKEKLWIEDTY
jgi:hypothetical protein